MKRKSILMSITTGVWLLAIKASAEYHRDIDAVVVQFINTTDFDGYEWNLSEITINRIVKIIRKLK